MGQYCFEDDVDVLVELERMVTLTRAVLKGEPILPIREFAHDIWLFFYRLCTFSSMSHLISMLNPPWGFIVFRALSSVGKAA